MLHKAIARGDEFAATFLVKHGADMRATTVKGSSPLHFSAQYGLLKIAQELLGRGADINRQNGEGNTPTHLAIKHRHAGLTKLFLENPKVDINARNAQVGRTESEARGKRQGMPCTRTDVLPPHCHSRAILHCGWRWDWKTAVLPRAWLREAATSIWCHPAATPCYTMPSGWRRPLFFQRQKTS